MIKAFQTDSGIFVPAVTTDQMREVDRIAMEETGPNLYQMMENAGRTLAQVPTRVLGVASSLGRLQVRYRSHEESVVASSADATEPARIAGSLPTGSKDDLDSA